MFFENDSLMRCTPPTNKGKTIFRKMKKSSELHVFSNFVDFLEYFCSVVKAETQIEYFVIKK